jgi:hypothetical protein
MSRIHAGLAFVPVAASLTTGCATMNTAPTTNPADELVPVSSVQREAPPDSSFVRSLTPEQKETYKNLAVNLGATVGARGNVQGALAVRLLQMLGQ